VLVWGSAFIAHAGIAPNDQRTEIVPHLVRPGQSVLLTYQPSHVPAETVYVHYGFNGWNLRTFGDGAGREESNGNIDYFLRRQMAYNYIKDRYEIEIEVPSAARALHYAFCWNFCSSGEWDNNSKNDYSWPIVFPYIGPLLSWDEGTDPSSGVVVSFENSW